jgi:vesicle coat complex subunit
VLAANSVLQDCADLNPVVKCLGITSLAAIPDLIDHAPGVVLSLLSDGHPRVRLSAVQACYSLNSHTPTALTEYGIVDTLYACVRDSDPQVR